MSLFLYHYNNKILTSTEELLDTFIEDQDWGAIQSIGITGMPGAGKTFFSHKLTTALQKSRNVVLVDVDIYQAYERPKKKELMKSMQKHTDFLQTFNKEAFVADISNIKNNTPFTRTGMYDRSTGTLSGTFLYQPHTNDLLIAEGSELIYTPLDFDLYVCIVAPNALCLKRKIERSGYRSAADSEHLFLTFEKPLFESGMRDFDADRLITISVSEHSG